MPKVYIDVIDKKALDYLREAINDISNVSNGYINVPNDFIYKAQTTQLINDIKDVKKKLDNLSTWLMNSQNEYRKLLDDLTSDVNKIKDVNVNKINNKIKE